MNTPSVTIRNQDCTQGLAEHVPDGSVHLTVTSRHVDNCLSALRTRELITGRGDIRASDELF